MSDLQISLLAIGTVVVAGVMTFNWWQSRKYRSQAEAMFKGERKDALFQTPSAPLEQAHIEERIEPVISTESSDTEMQVAEGTETETQIVNPPDDEIPSPVIDELPTQATNQSNPKKWTLPQMDEAIDFIIEIHAAEPIYGATVRQGQQDGMPGVTKVVHWFGLNHQTGAWEAVLEASDDTEFVNLAAALQLADRGGAVTKEEIGIFCETIQDMAGKLYAVTEIPDKQEALKHATSLDEFAASVDVLIGLNVVSKDGESFPGTKIRGLAESSGMRLMPDGTFHYFNEDDVFLYSLCNHESNPFANEAMKTMTTHGITLLLDVPRVANGLRVFDQMVQIARKFANALNGDLVDDNRKLLKESDIGKIREQLAAIYGKMNQHGIPSGSPQALRLFA